MLIGNYFPDYAVDRWPTHEFFWNVIFCFIIKNVYCLSYKIINTADPGKVALFLKELLEKKNTKIVDENKELI